MVSMSNHNRPLKIISKIVSKAYTYKKKKKKTQQKTEKKNWSRALFELSRVSCGRCN